MASDNFLNSKLQYSRPMTLPTSESQGSFEALNSQSLLKSIDNLGSDIGMAELNSNFVSNVMNSAFLENFSNSRSTVGDAALANMFLPSAPYVQCAGNTDIESYMTLPLLPVPCLSNNPMNIFSLDNTLAYLCQGGTSSTDLTKSNLPTFQDSFPVQIQSDPLSPFPKKSRYDLSQENVEQQIMQELLLTDLHDGNPQLRTMIEQFKLPNQFQPPMLHSAPQVRGLHPQLVMQLPTKPMTSILQDLGDQHGISAPLLDGGICSQRFRHYLHCFRSHIHENDLDSWKKFVSDYYAPGSKKRWCFSSYENIDLQVTGVFSAKSMETWCCGLCGAKSGKGLEATFEIFPRLFKSKFESGMIDEILFLDSPRACKISSGLMLEYGRVILESVYEKFRVVHEGKLRIVFQNDLKILSWEFCAKKHTEYLLRGSVIPQVNQIVLAARNYLDSVQNGKSSRMPSKDLQENTEMFESARNQLASSVRLPLVNALGYPKRFIRCLQIAEVVDDMTDLITFRYGSKMGPKGCLNNYSSASMISALEKQQMELFNGANNLSTFLGATPGSGTLESALANINRRLLGESYSIPSLTRKVPDTHFANPSNPVAAFPPYFNPFRKNVLPSYTFPRPQSAEPSKSSSQSLFDKLIHEIIVSQKGKTVEETFTKPNNEVACPSSASKRQRCGEESSKAASAEANSADVIRAAVKAVSHGDSVESRSISAEPELSPEQKQKQETQQQS